MTWRVLDWVYFLGLYLEGIQSTIIGWLKYAMEKSI